MLRNLVSVLLFLLSTPALAADPMALLLKNHNLNNASSGTDTHIAIMRHALAPGNGDPANFDVNDCNTQRNLSDKGREQARDIGDYLRDNGVDTLAVYSSAWCRCRETAELLDFGAVTTLPFLNSFYVERENEPMQTNQLRDWIAKHASNSPAILVTHQVNITALTGVYPTSGEIIIVKYSDKGTVSVAGRIQR